MLPPTTPLLVFLLALASTTLAQTRKDLAGIVDWHKPQIGIPLTRQLGGAPAFHPVASPSEDSIFTLTKSNVLASLSPIDGSIAWRHQLLPSDLVRSYHPIDNTSILLLSTTPHSTNARLLDSSTGSFLWETSIPSESSEQDSHHYTDSAVLSDGSGDLVVLVGGVVARLERKTGSLLWKYRSPDQSLYNHLDVSSSGVATAFGFEKTFEAFYLTTFQLSPSGEVLLPSEEIASYRFPTTTVLISSLSSPMLVYIEDGRLRKLGWDGEGRNGKPLDEHSHGSDYHKLEDVGLGSKGFVIARRVDGNAEILEMMEGGLEVVFTFTAAPESASTVFAGHTNVDGHSWISRTTWLPDSESISVQIYWSETMTSFTLPFDASSFGEILHVALQVKSTNSIRVLVTTSTGTVQLYGQEKLEWSREESLAEIKTMAFVDLPELEATQTGALENESLLERLARQLSEIQLLPGYLARFASRFVSSNVNSMLVASIDSNSTFRDRFGFHKILLVGTSTGKVFGLDSSNGRIIWSQLLGTSTVDVGVDIQGVWTISPAKGGPSPRAVAIGVALADSVEHTMAFELDVLDGSLKPRHGVKLFDGRLKDAFLLDDIAAGQLDQLAVLDRDSKVHVFPPQVEPLQVAPSLLIVDQSRRSGLDTISGLNVSVAGEAQDVWTFPLSDGESVRDIVASRVGPVASFGRVLGDRTAMYKYLNPHLTAITTVQPAKGLGNLYLIDAVRGSILHHAVLPDLDIECGIQASLVDNWLLYTYRPAGSSITGSTGQRIVSAEMFEMGVFQDKIGSSELTSFSAEHNFRIVSQAFIMPGVKALATTTSRQGIATKDILIANDNNQLISIARRWLDPRRPLGPPSPADREEGLISYDSVVPIDNKKVLSHEYELLGISKIETSPSLLESTTIVFAYGLDLFSSRTMPSGTFDILSDSFNKAQLLLTMAALTVGILVTKPIVEKRRSKGKWF